MCCQSRDMSILHWSSEQIDSIDSRFLLITITIMVRLDENLWEQQRFAKKSDRRLCNAHGDCSHSGNARTVGQSASPR